MSADKFKFKFTAEQVREILKGNAEADAWYEAMVDILPKYDIVTEARVAGFIAQTAHESGGYKVLQENLNYSADGLNKIFPKYFKNAGRDANQYARQPEKIANVVYASRMGNGDTASGDGWKHRGRGLIQLTGKENYTNFAKAIGKSLDEAIAYVATKEGALESACWYWNSRSLNATCDAGDIVSMTKKINGGTIGIDDRKKHFNHALEVFGGNFTPSAAHATGATSTSETLKKGSSGPTVAKLQEALGVTSDGSFGPGTEAALKKWQASHGLVADGVAGPKTLAKLLG